jgi:16S rRNA (cytosine1402-N4)-methyltransferase
MENNRSHISVLKEEVLKNFNSISNENFIDATFNGGGHTMAILEKNRPKGKVLAIELDRQLLEETEKTINPKIKHRLILVNDNFKNLKEIVKKNCPGWLGKFSGIILDLGFSSWHIEQSERGFSFIKDEILDMRYGNEGIPAMDIINKWTEQDIEAVLREYGEERFSRKIARIIVEARKIKAITRTSELVEIIKRSVHTREKIHPATRTFQALRIAANDELGNLKKVLPQAIEVLKKGGVIEVISFHSLEDRVVKNFFRDNKNEKLKIITKKPIRPSFEEIKKNPRSRSAKLRVAIKI